MKKRDYKQNCALALSSDLLCERWTLLIFRELLIQPCRFKELNQWLEGMGTNLLTQRLKDLEHEGLIEKENPADKRSAYRLTPKGHEVEEVVLSLIRWGHLHLEGNDNNKHYHHWDLLAMKALFQATLCKKKMTVQFLHKDLTAWAHVSPTGFTFSMGVSDKSDIEINATVKDLQAELQSKQPKLSKPMHEFVACFKH